MSDRDPIIGTGNLVAEAIKRQKAMTPPTPQTPPAIRVQRVIGTGDPLDMIFLVPLVHQWGASRACATEGDSTCEAPLRRIVILAPPGFTDDAGRTTDTLAYCEPHFGMLMARSEVNHD